MTINGIDVGTVMTVSSKYLENLGLILECEASNLDAPFRLLVDKFQVTKKINDIVRADKYDGIAPEFKEEIEKHPELAEKLFKVYGYYIKAVNGIRDINNDYKVQDWTWEFDDPSDVVGDFTQFEKNPSIETVGIHLSCDRFLDSIIERQDEYTNKRIDCSCNKHSFIEVVPWVRWCSVCGAIEKIENGKPVITFPESYNR